jgi:hypothetical protein
MAKVGIDYRRLLSEVSDAFPSWRNVTLVVARVVLGEPERLDDPGHTPLSGGSRSVRVRLPRRRGRSIYMLCCCA